MNDRSTVNFQVLAVSEASNVRAEAHAHEHCETCAKNSKLDWLCRPCSCHKYTSITQAPKHYTFIASYPGLPMFFNICEKNREGLVDLVM